MSKIVIFALGSVVFFIIIRNLLTAAYEQNLKRSFVRVIDVNNDNIVSIQQVQTFKPCQRFSQDKLVQAHSNLNGISDKKVQTNQLAELITINDILTDLEICPGNWQEIRNIEHIKTSQKSILIDQLFNTYDLNKDDMIIWTQYHLVNLSKKGSTSLERKIFGFLDLQKDWKITKDQLEHVKPQKITTYLERNKRK